MSTYQSARKVPAESPQPGRVDAVERPSPERPRLVMFTSRLDGPSRRVEGYLAQVLQRRKNHGTFVVHHVDVGDHPDLAGRFRVDEVPTLIVVHDRRVQARLPHPRGCRAIEEMLKPWLRH